MKTLDRYILRQFLLNLVILFAVMTLLILLLDLISNLDEFVKRGTADGRAGMAAFVETVWAIADFYGPQVLQYFSYMAGILPVAAAGFTLAGMMRSRELVAMVAGGVSLHRVAMPIFLGGVLCCVIQLVNQEFIIPQPEMREKLARKRSDVRYGHTRPFSLQFVPDGQSNLFCGSLFDTTTNTISDVTILKRDEVGRATERISATSATWDAASHGWKLVDGTSLRRTPEDATAGERLAPQAVAFFPSDLDPTTIKLRHNASYRQLLSVRQLQALSDKPLIVDTRDLTRIIHARFSLLVMNLLILGLGLPFFLKRAPVNLLKQTIMAAPLCIGAWAGGMIMLRIGPENLPPAAIAWMPVLIYLPVSLFLLDRVET